MTFSVPEIAQQLNISEELAEEARRLLWTFDPPGVGARGSAGMHEDSAESHRPSE